LISLMYHYLIRLWSAGSGKEPATAEISDSSSEEEEEEEQGERRPVSTCNVVLCSVLCVVLFVM